MSRNITGTDAATWFAPQSFNQRADELAGKEARTKFETAQEYARQIAELDRLIAEAEAARGRK